MVEYEAEFNRLVKFTLEDIKDSDRAKIQKFKNGLNVGLQHDVQGFEIDDFGVWSIRQS